jgi:hypothetical protein
MPQEGTRGGVSAVGERYRGRGRVPLGEPVR